MFTSPATGSAGLVKQRYCKEEVRPTGERCRRLPRYTDVSRTGALHTCSFTPHPFHPFSPASETEAYCILIANVNYREGSMTLYGRTITCPRGDSIKSLDTWARLFRWSKTRTRRTAYRQGERLSVRRTGCNHGGETP